MWWFYPPFIRSRRQRGIALTLWPNHHVHVRAGLCQRIDDSVIPRPRGAPDARDEQALHIHLFRSEKKQMCEVVFEDVNFGGWSNEIYLQQKGGCLLV
jgi:hypothetical protein